MAIEYKLHLSYSSKKIRRANILGFKKGFVKTQSKEGSFGTTHNTSIHSTK